MHTFLLCLLFIAASYGQVTRTEWEYCRGPSSFTNNPDPNRSQHGDAGQFAAAVIPGDSDTCWKSCGSGDSFCTDGDNLGVRSASRLHTCWTQLDFSYFRTYVTIPKGTKINTFTIDFTVMDDGSQIFLINKLYPSGIMVPGSLVQLGGNLNFNFASTSYISDGDVNTLIIVQVDDCAVENNIVAVPTINGQAICPDDVSCNDNDPCTVDDVCTNGVCAGTPMVCTASDNCHSVGVCENGVCTNPAKDDGSGCDDGNGCTQNDVCASGSCKGTKVVCTALDQCHVAGVCQNGVCSNPLAADGTGCDDGNACTENDVCTYGACAAGKAVVCLAQDQCHQAGTCNYETGLCSNPVSDDGTYCYDGDLCTQTDVCKAGVCTGTESLECEAQDDCHDVGVCDPKTGYCSNPIVGDDFPCDDDNECTKTDVCLEGVCTGTDEIECDAPDNCHDDGECNPLTGVCDFPEFEDGTGCDDDNLCTEDDCCYSGKCSGTTIECEEPGQCQEEGTCDPTTGTCTYPAAEYNTECDDGDECTLEDVCEYGKCNGYDPVICTAEDACHTAGTCNPETGVCTNPTQPDGTSCSDHNACTAADKCQKGVCTPGKDQCCHSAKGCGICLPNCTGTNAQAVLDFYGLDDDKDKFVCNGGNPGKICSGTNVCCSPDDQSKVYFSSNKCMVPQ